jgi:1-acyl-sn-glycerol-3-phosphate acyltransferase
MIRTTIMFVFWAVFAVVAAVVGFPWTFISGKVDFLYRLCMWGAANGVRVAGVPVKVVGLDQLDPQRTYIFMANHASTLDPPILVPLIPRRTSVLVKKELFRVPILGQAMRMGSLVPVDRSNRDAAIASLRAAAQVLTTGINMTIFIEGTRSYDGRLLPFKKGPFYLAEESGAPIVPVTIAGSQKVMPKKSMGIGTGEVRVIFHPPMRAADFGDRDSLMAAVREKIASGLPEELQSPGTTFRKRSVSSNKEQEHY